MMTRNKLPQPIYDDLFNVSCGNPDVAIQYLADVIDNHGFILDEHRIDKVLVLCHLLGPNGINSIITINRLERNFNISANHNGDVFLPVTGSWSDVCDYLTKLTANTGD
jgi:hypothetical protein